MNFHHLKKILPQHTLAPSEWKGAVLFLSTEEHVFLVKRSETMPTHQGQVAFIGGHKKEDELDPWVVSRREFEEETHLSADCLDFLGYLPAVMTARQQPIVPVVAKLNVRGIDFLKTARSNGEWDEILAYRWSELAQEDRWNYAWRHGLVQTPVMFHTIRAGSYLAQKNNLAPHLLWGATAHMIWGLLRLYFKE